MAAGSVALALSACQTVSVRTDYARDMSASVCHTYAFATEHVANADQPAAYANPEKRKAMEQLRTLLLGALEARGRVLVKLNVDGANLQNVIDLLPALKSPTVSKLFGEDGYAVETVVSKSDINVLIPALKDAGATGLLELPISKIVQ